jgi:hypothetical protein
MGFLSESVVVLGYCSPGQLAPPCFPVSSFHLPVTRAFFETRSSVRGEVLFAPESSGHMLRESGQNGDQE